MPFEIQRNVFLSAVINTHSRPNDNIFPLSPSSWEIKWSHENENKSSSLRNFRSFSYTIKRIMNTSDPMFTFSTRIAWKMSEEEAILSTTTAWWKEHEKINWQNNKNFKMYIVESILTAAAKRTAPRERLALLYCQHTRITQFLFAQSGSPSRPTKNLCITCGSTQIFGVEKTTINNTRQRTDSTEMRKRPHYYYICL